MEVARLCIQFHQPSWPAPRIVILFQIKICGITSVKDARFASLAGANAIGLNFYEESPRGIDLPTAALIAPAIPTSVAKVGVFVNASSEVINDVADQLSLDFVQLHGDEPPDFLGLFPDRKLIRAFRCGEDGFTPIASYLSECRALGRSPDAVLIDAHRAGEFGGTGLTIDWAGVATGREILGDVPLVLAGGLTPFNVAEAIGAARPDAVDAASGLESAPGVKDILMIRAFCTTAKKAFNSGS